VARLFRSTLGLGLCMGKDVLIPRSGPRPALRYFLLNQFKRACGSPQQASPHTLLARGSGKNMKELLKQLTDLASKVSDTWRLL